MYAAEVVHLERAAQSVQDVGQGAVAFVDLVGADSLIDYYIRTA